MRKFIYSSDQPSPYEEARLFSQKLWYLPLRNIFEGGKIFVDFDPLRIRRMLDSLKMKNVLIVIQGAEVLDVDGEGIEVLEITKDFTLRKV